MDHNFQRSILGTITKIVLNEEDSANDKNAVHVSGYRLCRSEVAYPDGIKTIEVNGYDMAYIETGNGVPWCLFTALWPTIRIWGMLKPRIFFQGVPHNRG